MATRPEGASVAEDLFYDLPDSLIAQEPGARRDGARMMRVARHGSGLEELTKVRAFPEFLERGDLLVRNRTRVFPARLRGQRQPGGGAVEVLLLQASPGHGPTCWQALARPLKRLRVGQVLAFPDPGAESGETEAEVREIRDGYLWVEFAAGTDVLRCAERLGEVPLPPYIQRPEGPTGNDRDRYQTVYARENGSVAAPTAGLHLTDAMFEDLAERGVGVADIVLHVGAATFLAGQPGRDATRVEPESYFVPAETRAQVESCEGRVVAVGTTTTRALESAARQGWPETAASTDLVLQPGDRFAVVDGLLTNFHLPGSSLLLLVAAFGGVGPIQRAYRRAVAERYRFYSYGDAMLII